MLVLARKGIHSSLSSVVAAFLLQRWRHRSQSSSAVATSILPNETPHPVRLFSVPAAALAAKSRKDHVGPVSQLQVTLRLSPSANNSEQVRDQLQDGLIPAAVGTGDDVSASHCCMPAHWPRRLFVLRTME